MELNAEELRFKIFKLHQQGIIIPEYEKIIVELRQISQELGDIKKDLDYWCGRLTELEICKGAIESIEV